MNAMVSARVPVEIKKQGDQKLKEIGSSVTELINAAYEYLIRYGKLPKETPQKPVDTPQVKTLTGDALHTFQEQWQNRQVLNAPGYDGQNFKELLDQAREDYHARLA
ncbi:MAG: hypothetical protein Q4D27_03590 [Coriobacteriia bacterium]|nr:hypothetical protein [Coriobacteriia bacterium]